MTRLCAALQLVCESTHNPQSPKIVLKEGHNTDAWNGGGGEICSMSVAYYPFAVWNLTSYLDHTRLPYSHAVAVFFNPRSTVQARPTTLLNFNKLQSNASQEMLHLLGVLGKKHQQLQEQQKQRHVLQRARTRQAGRVSTMQPAWHIGRAWDLSQEERAQRCSNCRYCCSWIVIVIVRVLPTTTPPTPLPHLCLLLKKGQIRF